ncbi:MAG: DUF551 domain-containing protein [Deltaproteobacteria bacterium]|nr:DUF551 domain-containing protein [Deltaproteobacteria bacterium]
MWISVKDRNPEKFGEYLGSTRARPRGWVFMYAQVGWVCSRDYPVTHWMPLPAAPHTTYKAIIGDKKEKKYV